MGRLDGAEDLTFISRMTLPEVHGLQCGGGSEPSSADILEVAVIGVSDDAKGAVGARSPAVGSEAAGERAEIAKTVLRPTKCLAMSSACRTRV